MSLEQIAFPETQFLNDPYDRIYFAPNAQKDIDDFANLVEEIKAKPITDDWDVEKLKKLRWRPSLQEMFKHSTWAWVDEFLATEKLNGTNAERRQERRQELNATANRALSGATVSGANISSPGTKSRPAQLPFPRSQLIEVYGFDFVRSIDKDTYRAFVRDVTSKPCTDSDYIWIHLPDVRGYLQEEVAAAYKLLSQPCNADLWHVFCTPELVRAVRSHQFQQLAVMRRHFKEVIGLKSVPPITLDNAPPPSSVTALAWAIIVHSALLTDQLVEDMKESAASKSCPCPHDGWLDYYSPQPSAEARQAFNEYVRCRWPIHVFALDPAAQQQNIADTFSSRREMQLAMSLAFVNGQISARNMMRYARRIEFDFATIDLNGTAVGFSHGDDTFGWRFYPRFQTPDVESNATVITRDLIIGGPTRNDLLKMRRLEPGMRECVAVVIMPSFVPCATMNVSSNWFKLTNPKCKLLDSTDAMKLSMRVKSIQNCATNVTDAECYRDGDFDRLLQKAKQLETRLPLQSTMVQVPYENTLGGFAMFNTGVTDLAPELIGWYGSPSINPKAATTLFLVGNHFSVHQTRVIAGGQELTPVELLSRQVMKVTVPAGSIQLGDACQKFVDFHVATPYGVTQHLLVPVCIPPEDTVGAGAGAPAWKPNAVELAYEFGGIGIVAPAVLPAAAGVVPPAYRPPSLLLQKVDIDPALYPTVDITLKPDKKLNAKAIVLAGIAYDSKQDGYVVTGDVLAAQVFASLGPVFGPESTNPPCAMDITAELKFNAAMAGAVAVQKKAGNALTIKWVRSPHCAGSKEQ
jgi:hypothetical protein